MFVSHCYQSGSDVKKVDFRLEQMDFTGYEGIWLGVDVCSENTLNFSTVAYIDRLFDLGNPENAWTLGTMMQKTVIGHTLSIHSPEKKIPEFSGE